MSYKTNNFLKTLAWFTVPLLASIVLYHEAQAFTTSKEVSERIQPYGTVDVDEHKFLGVPASDALSKNNAKNNYDQYCASCHNSGVAEAPKFRDKASWAEVGEDEEEAEELDDLLDTVVRGEGAMPPKGSCLSCSEDDLRAIIEYMLPQ